MEEGAPTALPVTPEGSSVLTFGDRSESVDAVVGEQQLALASSRAAWQKVEWKDALGISVNSDTTKIEWTYNGTDVTSGQVSGFVTWYTKTGWSNVYAYHEGNRQSGGDFYRGNTWSKFKNSF